jgi:hypothetical protein
VDLPFVRDCANPQQSTQYSEYRSLPQAFRSLLAANGIRGLFQGVVATAARDAPYAGLSVFFYEEAKDIAGMFRHSELTSFGYVSRYLAD